MARVYVERRELPADLIRLLDTKSAAAECTPPMDAVETAQAIEVMAERTFGRFARAVSVEGAFDAGHATAALVHGELRGVLPRIADRRGRQIRIPIG